MRGSSQRTHIGHPKMLAMHGIFKEKERRFAHQRKRRLAYLGNFSVYKDTSNGALPQDTNLPQRLQRACCLAHPHGAGMQPICIMFQRSQKNSSIDPYAKTPGGINPPGASITPFIRQGRIAQKHYARVRISSVTLAINSSTVEGTVSLERSRTEMLPASASFSPRMSI